MDKAMFSALSRAFANKATALADLEAVAPTKPPRVVQDFKADVRNVGERIVPFCPFSAPSALNSDAYARTLSPRAVQRFP